jgi:NAD(P)-dependent dehydrogenase (short-subunit alcohol dehydrogenase family)
MTSPKPTLLLTGANGGLGIGCVQNILASKYAETHHAIYTVRSLDSAGTLRSLLASKAPKGHSYEVLALDFGKLSEVKEVVSLSFFSVLL